MNNYSDSDDSDDENNELPSFSPDLLLDVPKQLQKVKFRLKSEPTTVATGTNIILKEEEKLTMTDKLNTLRLLKFLLKRLMSDQKMNLSFSISVFLLKL